MGPTEGQHFLLEVVYRPDILGRFWSTGHGLGHGMAKYVSSAGAVVQQLPNKIRCKVSEGCRVRKQATSSHYLCCVIFHVYVVTTCI